MPFQTELYNLNVLPAIFLDRDGVIIENRDAYVRSWDDVSIYPQALQALAAFRNAPFYFVIVTNQSAVGRGIISQQEAEAINTQLVKEITLAGGRIDAVRIMLMTSRRNLSSSRAAACCGIRSYSQKSISARCIP